MKRQWIPDQIKKWVVEFTARLSVPLIKIGLRRETTFDIWEHHGIHVIPVHFYSPLPDTRALRHNYPGKYEMPGVDLQLDQQLALFNDHFIKFKDEYNQFDLEKTTEDRFYLANSMFSGIDPHIYHCMIRHFQPSRIVEVGSGYSTLVSAAAAALNTPQPHIFAIEPYPPPMLKNGIPNVELLENKVETIDISFFSKLKANDILFIDSSHVVKAGGDVWYLFFEVIPRLKNGVIVHIHDIFFPYHYLEQFIFKAHRFWNEQYLLHAYLLQNHNIKILGASHALAHTFPDEMRIIFPKAEYIDSGSFWFQI